MKKVKSSRKKVTKVKTAKHKKRPSSYAVEQSIDANENGIYKFPGQFLLIGALLIFFWSMTEYPLKAMLLALGILSLGLEAVFLSRAARS